MPDSPGSIQSRSDEVGNLLAQADLGLVAARHAIDLVAFGLEIVAQEQGQRLLVLDDQDARSHIRLQISDRRDDRPVVLRPVDGEGLARDEVMDRLGDVRRVVADALDVLGAEQKVGAERDVARILHHVGEELAEQRRVEGIDGPIPPPDVERPSLSCCA